MSFRLPETQRLCYLDRKGLEIRVYDDAGGKVFPGYDAFPGQGVLCREGRSWMRSNTEGDPAKCEMLQIAKFP
jgi:hypothetical protein